MEKEIQRLQAEREEHLAQDRRVIAALTAMWREIKHAKRAACGFSLSNTIEDNRLTRAQARG